MSTVNYLIFGLAPIFSWGAVPTVLNEPEALKYAEMNLSHVGTLHKTDKGFVYLKVSDDYITQILPLLHNKNLQPPPYFGPGLVGAHVSIILPGELDWSHPPQFPSMGTEFPFNISHFKMVSSENQPSSPYTKKVDRYYFFTLEAPALELLRITAGLSPKIDGHDFHITVGVLYADIDKLGD